jgi:hypothetical protein
MRYHDKSVTVCCDKIDLTVPATPVSGEQDKPVTGQILRRQVLAPLSQLVVTVIRRQLRRLHLDLPILR